MNSRSKRRESATGNPRALLETLETRQMLSVSVVRDTLVVNGTGGNDVISISVDAVTKGMLRVNVNGLLNAVETSGIRRVNISGLEGNDQILVDQSRGVIRIPVNVAGGSGNDSITGGSGEDLLQGGRGNDLVRGSDGHDVLEGHAGNDTLYGASGVDRLDGGGGADALHTGGYRKEKLVADGLDSIDRSEPHYVPLSESTGTRKPNFFNEIVTGLTPAQIRTAYGLDGLGLTGAGQTIAIVDAYHSPTVRQDLERFSAEFNLPPITKENFQAYYATKVQPQYDAGWAGEIALDVQWAHAVAPDAKIILVEAASASFADLEQAVDRAVELLQPTGGVVSMSYGSSETYLDPLADLHFRNSMTDNVSFFAATGDFGAQVSSPAVSPNVTAVGGTFINVDAAGNFITPEEGWTGSGGGISSFFPRPEYQDGVDIDGRRLGNRRAVPDVAFLADPRSGVAVFNTSPDLFGFTGWSAVGGTSLAAPMWAAYTSLVNERRAELGKEPIGDALNTALYRLADEDYATYFKDITSGTNGYPATEGYDLVTGLGVPQPAIVEALAQADDNAGNGANVLFEAARLKLEPTSGRRPATPLLFFGGTGFATNNGGGNWDLDLVPNVRSGVSIALDGPLTPNGRGKLETTGTINIVLDADTSQSYNLKVVARETGGGLVGEFFAVSRRGKMLYQGEKPLFYGTFDA
jgi:hypothetical protein